MTGRAAFRVAFFSSLLASLCACQPSQAPVAGYFGPTLSLDQLITRVNQNNNAIPTLWARVYLEATFVDPKDKSSHFINGDGTIQYAATNFMRLEISKELADLFAMGSDATHYWLWQKNDSIFWWGSYADIDKPHSEQIPIRPDLVMEVLGVRSIDPLLLDEPAPVLRFNSDADVYMVVWQFRLGDHWVAQKEIWYDRATLHPTKVLLFDKNGRVVLRAGLSGYAPLQVTDIPAENQPQVATRYLLFFPESGSHVSLTLRDETLSHKGFPKAASFHMPDPAALGKSGVKVHAIDEPNNP